MKAVFAHDHIFYRCGPDLYSNGGLSYQVLARYLKFFSHINVLSRQSEVAESKGLTLASGDGVSFSPVPNFKRLGEIRYYLHAKRIVDQVVLDSDCVVARMPSAIASLAISAAIKHGKPYVVEVVGCAWDANVEHGSALGKVVAPFQFYGMRRAVERSKFVIYITREFLQGRYPNVVGVCGVAPNVKLGVAECSVLDRRVERIVSRRLDEKIRIGLIGSLDVDYKGHRTLLKALAIAKPELPPFEVEFLGKGNVARWEPLIQRLGLTESVKFVGSLPAGREVLHWIDSLDVQIQPSSAEAQGRSIIEGMSRACPIIATKVGGIVELIDSSWLVKSGDSLSLAERIKALVSSKDLLIAQAKTNFKKSMLYEESIVESSRSEFFKLFLKDCCQ